MRTFLLTLSCALLLAVTTISADSVLSRYRGVTLGDMLPAVLAELHLAASDVKTLHETPEVVQELTWRPRLFITSLTAAPDAVADLMLTFRAGRLERIEVNYAREHTQGLTNADLLQAMEGVYGMPTLLATPTAFATTMSTDRQTISRWEDAETLLILWREQYPNRVGMTMTSVANNDALQKAIAEGTRQNVADAPARELARQKSDAAAAVARDEKIRLDNKAKFKP